MDKNLIILVVYIGFIGFMSLVTFFLYGKDKSLAKAGRERIKEKTLLSAVAIGGAIGGFLGRIIFHHKTDKIYFSFVIYLSLLMQAATLGILIFLYFKFNGGAI